MSPQPLPRVVSLRRHLGLSAAIGALVAVLSAAEVSLAANRSCPGLASGHLVVVNSRVFQGGAIELAGPAPVTGSCIGCHDGTVAHAVVTQAGSSSIGRSALGSPTPMENGHPVDFSYPAASAGLIPAGELDARLHLEGGRITCLTCHPQGESGALAISMSGSRLCLSCHLK